MTIKTRNNIIMIMIVISALFILTGTTLVIMRIIENKLLLPEHIPYKTSSNFIFTKFSFFSVIISVFIFLFYAFTFLIFIKIEFEKTQAVEIIYFSIYLISCIFETFRLIMPLFNLWTSFSVTIFASRFILIGRMLASMSLLFVIIYSSDEFRSYAKQNIIILLTISIAAAKITPLNTQIITPLCHIQWSFEKLFKQLQYISITVTIISALVKSLFISDIKRIPYGFIFLSAGYLILINTFNYFLLFTGTAALFAGTFVYLKQLHSQYMWEL